MADQNIKDVIKQILADEAKVDESTQKLTGPEGGQDGKTAAAATIKGQAGGDYSPDKKDVPEVKIGSETNGKKAADTVVKKSEGNKLTGAEKGSRDLPGAKGDAGGKTENVVDDGVVGSPKKEESTTDIDDFKGNKPMGEDTIEAIKDAGKNYLSEKLTEASGKLVEAAKASIKTLVEGFTDLDEAAKTKVSTLFEATVADTIKSVTESTQGAFVEIFEEVSTAYHEELSDQVDTYLSYVAGEWLKENKLAVYHGTRQQIAESLIEEMREVFERHDLALPESKLNLLERAVAQIEKLEADFAEKVNESAELNKQIANMKKASVVEAVSKEMTLTQKEKVQKLAEEVEFKDEESFKTKLNTLVEHYFTKAPVASQTALLEDVAGEKNEVHKESVDVDPQVAAVAAAMSVMTKNMVTIPKSKSAK